jgi:hypothetical protein
LAKIRSNSRKRRRNRSHGQSRGQRCQSSHQMRVPGRFSYRSLLSQT